MKKEELSDKSLSPKEQARILNRLASSRSGTVVAIVLASWLWLLIVWVSR